MTRVQALVQEATDAEAQGAKPKGVKGRQSKKPRSDSQQEADSPLASQQEVRWG